MHLTSLDFVVIAICLTLSLLPALFFARRAGRQTSEFFAAGRAAPWWLIGTSMVATTFSTDTPNLVTDFVRTHGVSYNWVWWAFLLTGMMTVFFYARLWRRSGVLTDLEFYELRYAGRPAQVVRGFRAVYLGLFFNCCIMATVTLAAVKIANIMLGWDRMQTVVFCGVICVVFSALSGLWGVLATDLFQFAIAMVGVFAAAYYALGHPSVGGLAGLLEKVDPATLSMVPALRTVDPATGAWSLNWASLTPVLIIPLTIQWWSVWYPGAEPGGGSYIAQRMLAARDERHAVGATLWFNVAHYALRPWPWIIVALASILVFPTLDDLQAAFPHIDGSLLGNDIAYPAMLTLLPSGLLGLLVASLLAAYISTMSTHLNWALSYLVHDLYRRFLKPQATERHYIWVSRLVTAGLMLASAGFMFLLTTAGDAFKLLLSIGAGTGLIYLLRWYWWRINAWSEIAAMVASMAVAIGFFLANKWGGIDIDAHVTLLATVGVTTAVWVLVTMVTPPVDAATLTRFCRLVQPAGPGWKRIRDAAGIEPSPDSIPQALLGWVVGCVFVYSALFGAGSFIYGRTLDGLVFVALFVFSGVGLAKLLPAMLGSRRDLAGTEPGSRT